MFKEISEMILSFLQGNKTDSAGPASGPAAGKNPVSYAPGQPAAKKPAASGRQTSSAGPAGQEEGFVRAAENFTARISRDRFLKQQVQMADREGPACPYAAFNVQMPQYSSLRPAQMAYYLYWRSQFRKGLYQKTDSGYIRLLCFEILSGTGWKDPADGLDQLQRLIDTYGEKYPILCGSLCLWHRDFAVYHRLPVRSVPKGADLKNPSNGLVNIYTGSREGESPLKLPWELLQALIDYPLSKSRFWQSGYDTLMKEALPRSTALADLILRKRTGKGILETYMPDSRSVLIIRLYAGANAADAGRTVRVTVRNYREAAPLRAYLTDLVRFTENSLRSLMKFKGRLRDIHLDKETSDLLSAFLKREYDPTAAAKEASPKANETEAAEAAGVRLDFEKIQKLRRESDHVRDALEVSEEDIPPEIRLETILAAGTLPASSDSVFMSVSDGEADQILSDEETAAAAEAAGPDPEKASLSCQDPALSSLLVDLTGDQKQVLAIILMGGDIPAGLHKLAEASFMLPEQLIDEINEKSMSLIGDILIEGTGDSFEITPEYLPLLKTAEQT